MLLVEGRYGLGIWRVGDELQRRHMILHEEMQNCERMSVACLNYLDSEWELAGGGMWKRWIRQ